MHVAGEHEDSYDADFCIYNDVIVEEPDGGLSFCLYPADTFPPTDFHTATLVDGSIILIGSLGYKDLRKPGETQVFRLHTSTLQIEHVLTTGDAPGWISRHSAELTGENSILVIGGKVWDGKDLVPNDRIFELNVATLTWHQREHGDTQLFPVSAAEFPVLRNPRYGARNPEISDNSFWLEMAHRKWPPSRARLHFGDTATVKPERFSAYLDKAAKESGGIGGLDIPKLSQEFNRSRVPAARTDVIWTAQREEATEVTLTDGRRLAIGGQIEDYGDEAEDAWSYNDIIVTHPDGRIDIATYPPDIFPHLLCLCAVLRGDVIYIFGISDWRLTPERPRGPHLLRLDTSTLAITPIPTSEPPLIGTPYSHRIDGDIISFPVTRQTGADPHRWLGFNLVRNIWREFLP